MSDTDQSNSQTQKAASDYETELKAANEIVYKHSLELARLSKELETMNRQQETLLHFISHEIKAYLTKAAAAFASITQGDYGDISSDLRFAAVNSLIDAREGVSTVMMILDAANLKRGTVSYARSRFDLKDSVLMVIKELHAAAEEKHLMLQADI